MPWGLLYSWSPMSLQLWDYNGNYFEVIWNSRANSWRLPCHQVPALQTSASWGGGSWEEEAAGPSLEQRRLQRVCFESQRLPLFDCFSKTTVRKLDFSNSFISVTIENQGRQTEPESESWVNWGGGKFLIPKFSLIAEWNVHRARRSSVFRLLSSPWWWGLSVK